jgi:radical SAM protein (TIGR04043 family)
MLKSAPVSLSSDNAALLELITELQTKGLRLIGASAGLSRKGGAGPSDHKAVRVAGQTVMVPIHTHSAARSPFSAALDPAQGMEAMLYRGGSALLPVQFPAVPRFYAGKTADGIPYWKIATLHASDVLATTLLQKCVRYGNRATSCQFCAIGQSLKAGATIAEKSPQQVAQVAKAAVELDGVKHAVLTTGTPPSDDRGADVLTRVTQAITDAVTLSVQAQCEPPADFAWFQRMKDAGVSSLGLHLEAVSEDVRARIMPGKAEVPLTTYFEAFEHAVGVFGRGQVTTYILAGLGDTHAEIVFACERLAKLGVYPFVVPFVPIAGTPLMNHPAPSASFMDVLLRDVADVLGRHALTSAQIKAGCGRCGACSTMKAREVLSPIGRPRLEVLHA